MKEYIILLPSIFFLFSFITVLKLIQKSGVETLLKERISTDSDKAPVDKSSTSRFVLLLSGMAAVIIGVSLVTYYLWASVNKQPIDNGDMESVTKVLIALGIGVVPYAFNQLKNLFK